MLNIGGIQQGVVMDHIAAGCAMDIYHYLELDKTDACVAIIKNARSNVMGKKDIIKIEGKVDFDFDVLGVIDPNITINIIKDGEIAEKKKLNLPERVTNIIHCKNPRCITTVEQGIQQIFKLTDREKRTYRCVYCEAENQGEEIRW